MNLVSKTGEERYRFSGYIPIDLTKTIQKMADEDQRTFNAQVVILLEYAIREKTRKRKKS